MASQNVTVSAAFTPAVAQTPASGVFSGTPIKPNDINLSALFKTAGVLADQCDQLYVGLLNFVASTPQTLNLSSLLDMLGNAVAFARIRFIAIRIRSQADTFVLLVGGAGTTPFIGFLNTAGILTVFPGSAGNPNGGFTIMTAPNTTGMAVGAGVNLKLDPGANALGLVDIVIAGCTT